MANRPTATEKPAGFLDLLRGSGTISDAQHDQLLTGAAGVGEMASSVVINGWAEEGAVAHCLATFERTAALCLADSTIDLTALAVVPEHVAAVHRLLPIAIDQDTITVASTSVEPGAVVQRLASITARKVVCLRVVDSVLATLIPFAYTAAANGETRLRGRLSTHNAPHLAILRPAKAASQLELAGLINTLNDSFAALREAAHTDAPPAKTTPLPVPLPVPVVVPSTSRPSIAAMSPAVLVVEDDESIRRLIAATLRKDGCTVLEAVDGNEAFAILRTTRPALVVLDGMLPGIHGFEICGTIKRSSSYKDVPVIMVSAVYRGWENAREIQEVHGADAYLEKPFSVHVLRSLVAQMLGKEPPTPGRPVAGKADLDKARSDAAWSRVTGDWQEALASVDRWIALDPFDATAHIERGNLLLQKDQAPAAMRAYETAVAFDVKQYPAWVNLATAYERLGFERKAEAAWRRALQLAPNTASHRKIVEHLER